MKVGCVVSQHVRSRQQLHGRRDLSSLDSAGVELHLPFAIGHGCRDLGTLVALGECAGDG